jgi:NADPH:quinone reductase-like Zn-dependent oxidoreductase
MPLQELAKQVVDGTLLVQIGGTFHIDEIVEANRTMKQNSAGGKIVVLT